MLQRLRNWMQYFYRVPWCVPPWGWREMMVTGRCLLTGAVVRGPVPARFAEEVRRYLGVEFALATNRGGAAIELALRALGVGKGDDVVLPSYICQSVMDAVVRAGANPVFADVGPDLNVTAQSVRSALTTRTRCVIVAHLFGHAAAIDEIEADLAGSGIAIVDDAAQALGARRAGRLVGTFGTCGIVSCGPGKPIVGAAGGVLVTRDRELYRKTTQVALLLEGAGLVGKRASRFWFWRRWRRFTLPFRVLLDRVLGPETAPSEVAAGMSNLDGSIALEQFRELDRNLGRRRQNAEDFLNALPGWKANLISDVSPDSVLVKLVFVLPDAEVGVPEAIARLAHAGIECQGGYEPLHLRGSAPLPLPYTEAIWKRVLCIPLETRPGKRTLARIAAAAQPWKRDTTFPAGGSGGSRQKGNVELEDASKSPVSSMAEGKGGR